MRIGGLATGMDIDQLVNKLMEAEKMPLNKMEQDKTLLTWKRDGFRDINKALLELDEMMLDMKLSKTYNSKTISSSQEGAVTATGAAGAPNGSYNISVEQLATSAINISGTISLDTDVAVGADRAGTFQFSTYNEKGEKVDHEFTVKASDTINDVLKRITEADNNVRAFYDSNSNKVIMETTRTGKYNPAENGKEITFNSDNVFFKETLNLHLGNETGGTDAAFTYNNVLQLTSKDNSYRLNDITFEFKNKTVGDAGAQISVTNDVDTSFESIMKFVDKYNEVIEKLNETQKEEKYRDFKPLTEDQKEGMSEDQIKLWEEKAKSGILRGESVITSSLFSMRQSWYSNVDTGGNLTSLVQIGITTSSKYMDGGKLIVDEDKLKTALQEDPAGVQNLFSNSEKGASRGLVNRLEDSVEQAMSKIEERAGKGSSTLQQYTLGKRMKDLDERIFSFENRLVQVESRYWRQFSAMEKAIQRMNQQSNYLMSQFGQGV